MSIDMNDADDGEMFEMTDQERDALNNEIADSNKRHRDRHASM
jgi:hypothetical protein